MIYRQQQIDDAVAGTGAEAAGAGAGDAAAADRVGGPPARAKYIGLVCWCRKMVWVEGMSVVWVAFGVVEAAGPWNPKGKKQMDTKL